MSDDHLARYRRFIVEWSSTSAPWLTVTGLPGVGKSRLVAEALDASGPVESLRVLDPAPLGAVRLGPGERVLAVSTVRGLHPQEQVVEVETRADARAAAWFVDAARRAEPGCRLTAEDEVVGALVERVEGHRLALELLAGYLTVLAPAALLERLDRPAADGVDPLMHTTGKTARLRARFDEVWLSLAPAHRGLLSRFVVFAGPFSLADAEAVLGGDPPTIAAGLRALRARSLLREVGQRFAVPRIVARYVAAVRPAADRAHVEAHRRHFVRRASSVMDRARSDGQEALAALEGMTAELEGMVRSSTWRSTATSTEQCTVALALAMHAGLHGQLHQRLQRLEAVMAAAALADPDLRAQVHLGAAETATKLGRGQAARQWLGELDERALPERLRAEYLRISTMERLISTDPEQATSNAMALVRAARRLDDVALEACGLMFQGIALNLLNRPMEAIGPLTEAVAIYERLGRRRDTLVVRSNLHLSHRAAGQLDHARTHALRCLDDATALDDMKQIAICSFYIGYLDLQAWRLEDARGRFVQAWDVCSRIRFDPGSLCVGIEMARACLEAGEPRAAVRWLDRVEYDVGGAYRTVGSSSRLGLGVPGILRDILCGRALVALAEGHVDRAQGFVDQAVEHLDAETSLLKDVLYALLLQARVSGLRGETEAARASWQRARARLGQLDVPPIRCLVDIGEIGVSAVEEDAQVERVAEALRRLKTSWSIRWVLRGLWPDLPRDVRREAWARAASHGPSLTLDPDTRSARLPDGRWIDFGRRQLLWSLLQCVVAHPGPIEPEALIAAVWPDEAIHPEAAMNRLHNGLSLLRASGLRKILVRAGGGYVIAESVRVIVLDPRQVADLDTLRCDPCA